MSETEPDLTTRSPAEPVPSATVMLLRDGQRGLEVLMVRRHNGADFADAWVFPGGLAAQSDYERSLDPFCSGLDDAGASAQLGVESGGLGLFVAAIRECFEESGYLLARNFEGELCQPGDASHADRFADYRVALANNEIMLRDVCAAECLTLDLAALEYVSFWTTPVELKRRYATRFFVAAVPEGQTGVADGRETVDIRWVAPSEVIENPEAAAEMRLHPPTRVNLEWLAGFATVADALAGARSLDKARIQEIVPVIDPDTQARQVVLPDGTQVPL